MNKDIFGKLITNAMVIPKNKIERCNYLHSCGSCLFKDTDCSCEEAFIAWYEKEKTPAIKEKIATLGIADLAIDKRTGHAYICDAIDCADCLFDNNSLDCIISREEYIKENFDEIF